MHKKYNIDRLLAGIPYYVRKQLKFDDVALYSLSSLYSANQTTKIIFELEHINKDCTILDATASVGGNVYSFSNYFKYVKAVEIDRNRYNMLKHNITILQTHKLCKRNIKPINEDFLIYMNSHKINTDVIFFDPPWGGVDYKNSEFISLYLSDVNFATILKELIIKLVKDESKTKYIIIKAPNNLNMNDYLEFKPILNINKTITKYQLLIINLTNKQNIPLFMI